MPYSYSGKRRSPQCWSTFKLKVVIKFEIVRRFSWDRPGWRPDGRPSGRRSSWAGGWTAGQRRGRAVGRPPGLPGNLPGRRPGGQTAWRAARPNYLQLLLFVLGGQGTIFIVGEALSASCARKRVRGILNAREHQAYKEKYGQTTFELQECRSKNQQEYMKVRSWTQYVVYEFRLSSGGSSRVRPPQ